MPESKYDTLAMPVEHEIKVKRSRFIARATPVESRKAAEAFVASIRKQHHDATHNCFAYRIKQDNNDVTRFYDDGEPSGTAGKPILQAILGRELTGVVVVVTRYFGGIKLGTGGLIRAYGDAAAETLDRAPIRTVVRTDRILVEYAYEWSNAVHKTLEQTEARVKSSEYGTTVKQEIWVRKDQTDLFIATLTDRCAGNIHIEV